MAKRQSRFSAALAGLAGGAAGVFVMNQVMKRTKELLPDETKLDLAEGEDPLWSLVGEQHKPDESATAALGRIAYQRVTGDQPSSDTQARLSNAIHWSYGLTMGMLFGLVRGPKRGLLTDAAGGIGWGIGLWVLGDNLAVPLLGLSDKPTRFVPRVHMHTLLGHLAYGAVTAAGTRLASKVFT